MLNSLHDPGFPSFVEVDPADLGQEIDASGWKANLIDDAWFRQVVLSEIRRLDGGTEAEESSPDPLGIAGIGADPDIEVPSGSNVTMHRQGVGADDQKRGTLCVEESQHVPEVLVQRVSPLSAWAERIPERMTRLGVSLRG